MSKAPIDIVSEDQSSDTEDYLISDSYESESESESDSDPDDGDDDNWASDRESSSNAKPIVNPTNFQTKIEIDGLIPSNGGDKIDRGGAKSRNDESNNLQPKSGGNGLIRLNESDDFYQYVKGRFMSVMEAFGVAAQVEHIDRNLFNQSPISKVRLQSYLSYQEAMIEMTWGHPNIRQAWFGGSKDEINDISLHGFSHDNMEKDGAFGYGLYLSADNSAFDCLKSTTVDDDGMRRIVLCHVILGTVEAVQHGSKQFHPISKRFLAGVDNLVGTKKFIIWSTNINTHVLPEYVISFKLQSDNNGAGSNGNQYPCRICTWMSSKEIVSRLSKILPRETMQKINEYHRKYMELLKPTNMINPKANSPRGK